MGIRLKFFACFRFVRNLFSRNKNNAKLSNDIVHDLYTYAFFFVAVPLKASHRSMISQTSIVSLAYNYCGIFFYF